MIVRINMIPFQLRPPNDGQSVIACMKDGTEIHCNCTLIHILGERYINWYSKETGREIDVNEIKGWVPL